MRISTKLTFSLTAIGLLIFIAYGFYHLSIEQRDLTRVICRQTKLLGKGMQIAIENAMRDKQLADITELLKGLEQIEPELKVRVYDDQGQSFPDIIGNSYPSDFQKRLNVALQDDADDQFFYPENAPEYITLILPLQNTQGKKRGVLVFVRTLYEMHRDLDVTKRNLAISTLAFVLIAAPLCTVIGMVYIGWPLQRLANGMKRIRDGDFSPLPLINQKDEIGILLKAFNAMAAELAIAQQKLKQEAQSRRHLQTGLEDADKLITIGQLSAGLAHEIGSPLQILKGRGEHLLLCADQPEEVIRHARILVSQTERITRIVQQLLEFARRRPANITCIDLREPVNAVLNLLAYEAQKKHVELRLTASKDLPLILADSDGIQQIILNLITNALSASSDGGHIIVTIERQPLRPNPVNNQATETVQLIIKDNGCGMPPETLKYLFEPFFTTRHEQGGVGLGLAVAHSLVKAHHGSIKAESSLGTGSTFTIILPVEKPYNGAN
ncbi:ATP-binding protein [Methylobacter sp. S3L5C]|uniref:sensor histidine kinase n=1 Tax=Methylobacter sp. S3L5C TaxID=2839024 RepID=UPI001FAE4DB0|nr:ATP-binding protein [Methylobacter sp. S3L5C]UOA07691.1 HAMP domain-containing protein [Methylobacter sp. S3L5C]